MARGRITSPQNTRVKHLNVSVARNYDYGWDYLYVIVWHIRILWSRLRNEGQPEEYCRSKQPGCNRT